MVGLAPCLLPSASPSLLPTMQATIEPHNYDSTESHNTKSDIVNPSLPQKQNNSIYHVIHSEYCYRTEQHAKAQEVVEWITGYRDNRTPDERAVEHIMMQLIEDDDVGWDKSKRDIVDRLLPVEKTILGLFLRSAEDLEIPVHEAIFTEASRVVCKRISDSRKLPIIEVWCCMEKAVRMLVTSICSYIEPSSPQAVYFYLRQSPISITLHRRRVAMTGHTHLVCCRVSYLVPVVKFNSHIISAGTVMAVSRYPVVNAVMV
ncbi:hypothetical protein EDB81DRAFT_22495 [Dactylonectria macrodidyma]|uniref:Uncharacterized protein n=1 Tax=Dactylonectria macrodidyma TaxID=307937 RepID=A0A9P9JMK1_9HYPO|nr:hypothetical protein EDB81DRAFT_22495 [Dactylonectria macrodidyma]